MVSPYFFLEKSDDLFSSSLTVVSSPLPSSHVVYPVFFLNSATKNNFRSGVTLLWRVSPGVTPLEGVTRGGLPAVVTPLTADLLSDVDGDQYRAGNSHCSRCSRP